MNFRASPKSRRSWASVTSSTALKQGFKKGSGLLGLILNVIRKESEIGGKTRAMCASHCGDKFCCQNEA